MLLNSSMPPKPKEIYNALRLAHGEVALPPGDLFSYCLREICSFHTIEPKAEAAFHALSEIGNSPAALARARPARLKSALAKAGPFVGDRLSSLQGLLRLVHRDLGGDFGSLFKRSRLEVKKLLKSVPGFGDHGSDRLMLLSGRHPILALDTHGLRVALRLGYGETKRSYGATYASVQRELAPLVGEDPNSHFRLRELLRVHGREVCRMDGPLCEVCPLSSSCAYHARAQQPMAETIRFAT
jgi:endonuclease III